MIIIKIENLSMSNILVYNPIINDSDSVKREYFERLKKYLKIGGFDKRIYEKSLLEAYEKIILTHKSADIVHDISFYRNLIVFDLLHILGCYVNDTTIRKLKQIEKQYVSDFQIRSGQWNLMLPLAASLTNSVKISSSIRRHLSDIEKKYADVFMHNLAFRNKKPFRIMVTATMSAGKSTFINSLVGKYVCLSQNMACTSKIHSIYNKAFEDNYFYEYDHDLIMTAGREELVNDNELNYTDKIIVAGHFNGILSDERILIDDSPGVNFSEDSSHREITEAMLKRKRYDLLIYVMNATQLSTNDENEHLEFVRKTIGKTPLIFVLNKIDSFNEEDENVRDVIDRQIQYLKSKGFKEPIVCPLSARAGYLSKTCQNSTLSRSDERTLYYLVDKFERMRLKEYYKTSFPQIKVPYSDDEIEQLQNSCGLSYTEKIIKNYINGGKKL